MSKDPVALEDVTVIRETKRALFCRHTHGYEFWVPKSQIVEGSTARGPGDTGTLVVTNHIAEENGWDVAIASKQATGSTLSDNNVSGRQEPLLDS